MSALGWLFLGLLIVILAVSVAFNWWQDLEIQRLTISRHAKPRAPRIAAAERADGPVPAEDEAAGAGPAPEDESFYDDEMPPPDSLEWHAETAAAGHANAMWKLSEPYLPGRPPWVTADLPVWAEPPQSERVDETLCDLPVARPYAPQAGEQLPTTEELRDEYYRYLQMGCDAPDGPVYGQAPVAAVLEGERLARVMLP